MPRFLILRLDGPMQAWGTHTLEDYRPSNLFPTRSGLLGLIGACLGIERGDSDALTQLAQSVQLTVRVDRSAPRPEADADKESEPHPKAAIKLADFHSVLDARKVDGSASKFPVVSRREYLYDAAFTLAVGERHGAQFDLDRIAAALCRPRYTPVLGRRSCPITRPLLDEDSPVDADDPLAALARIPPRRGNRLCRRRPRLRLPDPDAGCPKPRSSPPVRRAPRLRPQGGSDMNLSRAEIPWPVAGNRYQHHRWIWRLFPGEPSEPRRDADDERTGFLFRVEDNQTGCPARVLVQSRKAPIPADGVTLIATREIDPQPSVRPTFGVPAHRQSHQEHHGSTTRRKTG